MENARRRICFEYPRSAIVLGLIGLTLGFKMWERTPPPFTLAVLVADAKTGYPLAGARVQIPSRKLVKKSDSSGEAYFSGLEEGYLRVTASDLGYSPMEANVLIGVSDSSVVVFLMTLATPGLDTVRVNARRIPGYLEEFETRRAMGLGRFLTEAQLDSTPAERLADVVARRFSGVRASWNTQRTEVRLMSTRGQTSFNRKVICDAKIYIDGFFRQPEDLAALDAGDVSGVEYYSNAPPVQYSRAGAACGAVLIWTKR